MWLIQRDLRSFLPVAAAVVVLGDGRPGGPKKVGEREGVGSDWVVHGCSCIIIHHTIILESLCVYLICT